MVLVGSIMAELTEELSWSFVVEKELWAWGVGVGVGAADTYDVGLT